MTKITHSLKSLHKILKENKPSKICLVTSEKLTKPLGWAIKKIGVAKSQIIFLPDGEKAKEWVMLEKLLEKFSELRLDRNSIIIALGGGTVGDVTGFVASIYLRGIEYIQIPTTLLAQVDSAHGGKTGINFQGLKNQIGTFYPPLTTVIDTRFLKSLSNDQIIDGLGEIIKAGLIKDASILTLLKKETIDTLIQSKNLNKIIDKAIKVKQYHIANDFDDKNTRQLLNAGHTFGHSIELKYKISHGKAVVIGLVQELAFTESLGLSALSVRQNLLNLLDSLGINLDPKMKADWKMILHDKKILGGKIVFPVIEKEGKSKLALLDLEALKRALN